MVLRSPSGMKNLFLQQLGGLQLVAFSGQSSSRAAFSEDSHLDPWHSPFLGQCVSSVWPEGKGYKASLPHLNSGLRPRATPAQSSSWSQLRLSSWQCHSSTAPSRQACLLPSPRCESQEHSLITLLPTTPSQSQLPGYVSCGVEVVSRDQGLNIFWR